MSACTTASKPLQISVHKVRGKIRAIAVMLQPVDVGHSIFGRQQQQLSVTQTYCMPMLRNNVVPLQSVHERLMPVQQYGQPLASTNGTTHHLIICKPWQPYDVAVHCTALIERLQLGVKQTSFGCCWPARRLPGWLS